MESAKRSEQELTSTMGSLLSTSKEEKNDASDSIPTSSTDAFTTTSTTHIAADDPISSTSSDLLDSKKVNDNLQSCSNSSSIMSSSIVSEKDLLDMNITDTSTEKITENVDDIVQDLENLLGEPTTTFDFTIRSKENKQSIGTTQSKEISMDFDEFSDEFQMLEGKPKDVIESKTTENQNDYENNRQDEVVEKVIDNSPTTGEDSIRPSEIISALENSNDENTKNNTYELIQKETSEHVASTCQEIEGVKDDPKEPTVNLDVSSTNFKESEMSMTKEEELHQDEIVKDESMVFEKNTPEKSPLDTSYESAMNTNNEEQSKEFSTPEVSIETISDGNVYNAQCELDEINQSQEISTENVNTEPELEESDSIPQNETANQMDREEVQMDIENTVLRIEEKKEVISSEHIAEPLLLEESEAKAGVEKLASEASENIISKESSVPNTDDNLETEMAVEPDQKSEPVQDKKSENSEEILTDISQKVEEIQVQSVISDVCEGNRDVVISSEENVVVTETQTDEKTENLIENIPENTIKEETLASLNGVELQPSQTEEIIAVENTHTLEISIESNETIIEKLETESEDLVETHLQEKELVNFEPNIYLNQEVEDCDNYQAETPDLTIVPTTIENESNVFESLESAHHENDNRTIFDNVETCNAEKDSVDKNIPSENEGVMTSSTDKVKPLEDSVIENNILPLVMEDVPDLDMLNAISTLSDNKPDLIPDVNLENNDTLLGSNTLVNEEPANVENVPFEATIDAALPTVDEIFAEPNDPLPDDNLETLLAVASLQGVCESSYNEDITSFPTPDEKIESLFEQKEPQVGQDAVNPTEETEISTPLVNESGYLKEKQNLKEPLVINVDDGEKEKVYSPKIIIKPIKSPVDEEVTTSESESNKGSLRMTITKQSDTMHSILKIYDPADETYQAEAPPPEPAAVVPKLIIKPIVEQQPHSPKTRNSKQVFSPSSQRSASPRITIKPIVKPSENESVVKITIKPVLKPEEKQKHSPKLTIKPIVKPEEETCLEAKVHSPRVTIKPVVKPPEESEQAPSPRITIKPIIKPDGLESSTPRVTIKPVVKPEVTEPPEKSSPKITIKPIVKPQESEVQAEDFEESIKERIVLKINKGTLPSSSKKRDSCQEESEKTPKIKLKFSKEGGHPHIVQEPHSKRVLEMVDHDKAKRQRIDTENFLPGVTITPIGPAHSKLKEMLSKNLVNEKMIEDDFDDDDVTIIDAEPSPIVISEESNQDSIPIVDVRDPISEIPVFEITPDSVKTIQPTEPVLPAPRKRGRPRKVPLQVREDFKDPKEEEPIVVVSTRPKRSCRGQSVRTTLGIKPRKPRGPGRGRGGKRGMGTRSTPTPETPKEPKLSAAKLRPFKEDLLLLSDSKSEVEVDDGFNKSPILAPPTPQTDNNSATDRADIVMYEEETRMSAETSSRAQTPAKQVVSSIPTVDLVEESQSSVHSVQSTATTESVKVRKGPRLEVHQEPEGAVISADQLAEYYWMGGGPYMLQEQVAQFLGIKSFKRKYPNIPRRVVDMQERDFIRESGLAGEAMCDLGLTAVSSSDILDIMYSDFQDKYEEYCKHQRDRQAKDLTNKQKALSLAASQEKTKIDITLQAVQSAASWNTNFNKARRDQRKACMDLQTLTVHFPKGKMKQINKPKISNYPVALVPGQFTDYYKEFTPTEINNLPLNTMCYDNIKRGTAHEMECDSQTDGSGSESETSTSDSDSSYSGSSDAEDCTICHRPPLKRIATVQ